MISVQNIIKHGCILFLCAMAACYGSEPIATLVPNDVPAGNFIGFAQAVAVGDDLIAIGAPGDPWHNGEDRGAVYLYRRSGPYWTQHLKLTDPDGPLMSLLGYSVALDGNALVAGAPRFEVGFPDLGGPGSVYVYRQDQNNTPSNPLDDTWSMEANLTSPIPSVGDVLGFSVDIDGDVIVSGNMNQRKVEVFRRLRAGWMHEFTLEPPSPGDAFGWSVSIDGDVIVVGDPLTNEQAGAAHVFKRVASNWEFVETLTSGEGGAGDHFGYDVSISHQHIIVGAPGFDFPSNQWEAGRGYLFRMSPDHTWTLAQKLTSKYTGYLSGLGVKVAIDTDLLLIAGSGQALDRLTIFQKFKSDWLDCGNSIEISSDGRNALAMWGSFAIVSADVFVVRNRFDLVDFSILQNCLGGLYAGNVNPGCDSLDFNSNGGVELLDFEHFTGTFVGP